MSARETMTGGATQRAELPALLQEPPLRAIVRLSAPTTGVMLVATTSNILHTYFVSRLGPEAIAAVALVFPISLILLTVAAGGLGTGIASAVARALGAGHVQEATRVAEQAFLITTTAAIAFTVVLEIGAEPLFAAMGGRGEVLRLATLFGRILFAGLLCPFTVSTLDNILRAEGNVRISATWSTVSLGLQIVLTPLFMFTAGLGLAGAPLATLTGQGLAAIPRLIFVFGGRGAVKPRLRPQPPARVPIREIIRVGAPASLSAGINYVGIVMLTSVFARYGTAHLAAYGLGTRLDFLLFTLGYGVAAAALTLVGMAVGAGRMDLALTYAKFSMGLAIGVVAVPAALVVTEPALWFRAFTDDTTIIAIGTQYLRCIGPSYMFIIGSMVLASSFQAFGRATAPMVIMVVRMTAVVAAVILVTSRWPTDARPGFLVIAGGNVVSLILLSVVFLRTIGRRSTARVVALVFVLFGSAQPARAGTSRFFLAGDGVITMDHAHFAEQLHVRYRDAAGHYDPAALATIARFFRSREDGAVGDVSLRLIELIDWVQDRYRPTKTTLISGYRSPEFNQRLRDSGAKTADASLHIEGIAADLHFDGLNLKKLWIALREQKIGGVGYYKEQRFLHIDTGRPRFWEPQTSHVDQHLSAGNARVFARSDFDRYADLTGAIVRVHSVTVFPLRIAASARYGATTVTVAPADEHATIVDKCIVFSDPPAARRLRVIDTDGAPSPKHRGPLILTTCAPRIEATPETIETNAIEVEHE